VALFRHAAANVPSSASCPFNFEQLQWQNQRIWWDGLMHSEGDAKPNVIQSKRSQTRWRSVMQDASYLRSQAELCLRIAHHIRDKNLATKFRAAATQYFLRAVPNQFAVTCAPTA
jgi:hypothetical protein